jgi:hypothetical protein
VALAAAGRLRRVNDMKTPAKQLLFWSPRVLGIFFAVFISIFAFDVFDEGYGLQETIGALLIHLIPTAVIVAILVLSWRREWIGGIVFIAFGALYLVMSRGRFTWSARVMIAGPLVLLGILFLINWRCRLELRSES